MKRLWGHVLAGLSLLAGAGAVFAACVHDDSTIFIRDALASKFAQTGMQCLYTPDPTQPFISSGVLDIALQAQYEGAFMVGNQMVPEVNTSQLQTETSTATIQGAVVRITDTDGKQIRTFTRLTSATIPPSTGGVPGWSPVFVTIIDPTALANDGNIQQLLALTPGQAGYVRLVTYTRFFGRTLGGQSVESNEFEFPVDVCNGCLVAFSNNSGFQAPNCVGNAASTTATAQPQIPCIPGQDLPIDCSLVCGEIAACRANTPSLSSPPPSGMDAGGGG
jgi:hypothetical protein